MVLLLLRLSRQANVYNTLFKQQQQQQQQKHLTAIGGSVGGNAISRLYNKSSSSVEAKCSSKINPPLPPPTKSPADTTPSAAAAAAAANKNNRPALPTATSTERPQNVEEKLETHEETAKQSTTATKTTTETTAPAAKQKLSREVVRQNVQGYVFTRYFDYVKNYDKVLEKNFPSAVKVYRVFFDGVKEFYADMKRYLKITRIVYDPDQGLKSLNRKELELYMQMPRDMVKVAPALIGSSLPMVGYAIFPLVFMYPRTFLTTHFWTLQQRAEFQELKLKERLKTNRAVFRSLQAKLHTVSKHEKHDELEHLLGLLGSGFHPTVDGILSVKDIFAEPPYSIMSLSGKHIKLLSQMHGVPGILFKRNRLTEHAFLIHHMDLAIMREGGVHNMPMDALRYACFLRGLNPVNLRNEDMIEWLRNWIKISTTICEEHISLFLHLPILLSYNHPNNWKLIYGSK